MSSLKFIAEEIKLKVVSLLERKDEFEAEIQALEAKVREQEALIRAQKNTIIALEESNKIAKLAGSLADSAGDIPALRKKLNGYIREIDECIRFLSERQV
jgi:hypothetical protein